MDIQEKKKMRKRYLRMFYSIIVMQLLGFLLMWYMRMNMDSYNRSFRDVEIKQYNVLVNLEKIATDIYYHRNLMGKCLSFSSEGIANENKIEIKNNRDEIEFLLIESEINYEDLGNAEDIAVYEELRDSVNAYFDYSDKILSEYEANNKMLDMTLYEKEMSEQTYLINANINKMEVISKNNIELTGSMMGTALMNYKVSFLVGMVLFFISTTISLVFCRKMLDKTMEM